VGTSTGLVSVNHGRAEAFGNSLLQQFSGNSFSTISKSELELIFFEAYLAAGFIALTMSDFEISLVVRAPVAKVKSLRYRHRLKNSATGFDPIELASSILFVDADPQSNQIFLSIEDLFYRDLLSAELRKVGATADSSFNRSIMKADADKLLEVLLKILGNRASQLELQINSAIKHRKAKNLVSAISGFLLDVASSSTPALLSQFIK
jgi:hypothetical protein